MGTRPGTERAQLDQAISLAFQPGDELTQVERDRQLKLSDDGGMPPSGVHTEHRLPRHHSAIAVTLVDPHHYAGLAPCGTALTSRQAAALGRAADLRRTGVLVAFDDDPAGRKAAIRAYDVLRPLSDRLPSVTLSGKDPAEILETEVPRACG